MTATENRFSCRRLLSCKTLLFKQQVIKRQYTNTDYVHTLDDWNRHQNVLSISCFLNYWTVNISEVKWAIVSFTFLVYQCFSPSVACVLFRWRVLRRRNSGFDRIVYLYHVLLSSLVSVVPFPRCRLFSIHMVSCRRRHLVGLRQRDF